MAGPEPDEESAVHSDVKSHLRNLLDAKEKQLQQAGTLGQRVLAQQMELEERIRQLQEDIEDESGGKSGVSSDAMEKLKDLADTLDQWERENSALSSGFGKSSASSSSTEESTGELPKTPPGPATLSRRAKNAAHRADDVEFAFEIGSGLLSETRRLQSLLGERDKAIQDLKEEKDDLEASVEGLRSALKQQEQSADKSKEENWNLEVSSQELRTELATSLARSAKLEGDLKSLTESLATTRGAHENAQSELAKTQNSVEQLRQKHENDITLAREQSAAKSEGGLSEEVNRLQTLLGERDSIIQNMQEERDDLVSSVMALRTVLKQMQEQSEGDNWNPKESLRHGAEKFSAFSGFGYDASYGVIIEPDQPVIDEHKGSLKSGDDKGIEEVQEKALIPDHRHHSLDQAAQQRTESSRGSAPSSGPGGGTSVPVGNAVVGWTEMDWQMKAGSANNSWFHHETHQVDAEHGEMVIAEETLAAFMKTSHNVREQYKGKSSSTPQRSLPIVPCSVPDTLIPMQTQQPRPQDAFQDAEALIPLGFPHNLPLATPPSSPRTTGQLLLMKELPESLRANLLSSRQLGQAKMKCPRWQPSEKEEIYPYELEPGTHVVVPTNVGHLPSVVQIDTKQSHDGVACIAAAPAYCDRCSQILSGHEGLLEDPLNHTRPSTEFGNAHLYDIGGILGDMYDFCPNCNRDLRPDSLQSADSTTDDATRSDIGPSLDRDTWDENLRHHRNDHIPTYKKHVDSGTLSYGGPHWTKIEFVSRTVCIRVIRRDPPFNE